MLISVFRYTAIPVSSYFAAKLQKKIHICNTDLKKYFFLRKNLRMSKKSCTFAPKLWKL